MFTVPVGAPKLQLAQDDIADPEDALKQMMQKRLHQNRPSTASMTLSDQNEKFSIMGLGDTKSRRHKECSSLSFTLKEDEEDESYSEKKKKSISQAARSISRIRSLMMICLRRKVLRARKFFSWLNFDNNRWRCFKGAVMKPSCGH